jgi:hypothetical protein
MVSSVRAIIWTAVIWVVASYCALLVDELQLFEIGLLEVHVDC